MESPYYEMTHDFEEENRLFKSGYIKGYHDAMIKGTQEAVEPIKPIDKDDDFTFLCSNCKGELFCGDVIRDNFCPTCGRSVKWECRG